MTEAELLTQVNLKRSFSFSGLVFSPVKWGQCPLFCRVIVSVNSMCKCWLQYPAQNRVSHIYLSISFPFLVDRLQSLGSDENTSVCYTLNSYNNPMKQLTCKCKNRGAVQRLYCPRSHSFQLLKPGFKSTLSSWPLRYQNVRGLNQADLLKRPSLNRLGPRGKP